MVYVVQFIRQWINMPSIPLSWSMCMWSSLSHNGSTCPQDHFHGLCGPVYHTMDQHALKTTFMVSVVQFITQWINMPPRPLSWSLWSSLSQWINMPPRPLPWSMWSSLSQWINHFHGRLYVVQFITMEFECTNGTAQTQQSLNILEWHKWTNSAKWKEHEWNVRRSKRA